MSGTRWALNYMRKQEIKIFEEKVETLKAAEQKTSASLRIAKVLKICLDEAKKYDFLCKSQLKIKELKDVKNPVFTAAR